MEKVTHRLPVVLAVADVPVVPIATTLQNLVLEAKPSFGVYSPLLEEWQSGRMRLS